MYIYKQPWVIPLRDRRGVTITTVLQSIVKNQVVNQKDMG